MDPIKTYRIASIIGYVTRIGQFVALFMAILNVWDGHGVGALQLLLALLLVYLTRKFGQAEVLGPALAPPLFYQYRGAAPFIIPLATVLLLFWVF